MAFIRTIKQENPYSQLDRYVFESDNSISWKAKGLMGYLLTRPDNWKINHSDLVKRAKDGKDSVTSALKELQEAGYIHYYQKRLDGGKFGEWIYDVYERPEFNPSLNAEKPDAENSDTVKPSSAKPSSEKADINNNNINKNDFNKNKSNKNNKSLLTKNDIKLFFDSFYSNYAPSRWSKKQWNTIADKFIEETNWNEVEHPKPFIEQAIKNIAYKHDFKQGKPVTRIARMDEPIKNYNPTVPFYDWLNEEDE